MIPAIEAQAHRDLWAAVALNGLLEHHKLIKRARRLGRAYDVHREIAAARSYITGSDFLSICSMAGLSIRPDELMKRLEAGAIQFGANAGVDWYGRKEDQS